LLLEIDFILEGNDISINAGPLRFEFLRAYFTRARFIKHLEQIFDFSRIYLTTYTLHHQLPEGEAIYPNPPTQ